MTTETDDPAMRVYRLVQGYAKVLPSDPGTTHLGLVTALRATLRQHDDEVERLREENRQVAQQIIDNDQVGAVKWAKGLMTALDADMRVTRIPACWIDGGDLDQLAQYGMGGVLGWPDDGGDPRRVPVYR